MRNKFLLRAVRAVILTSLLAGQSVRAAELKIDLTDRTPANAAARSVILPGWGQWFNGQPVKGTGLFLASAGSIAGSLFYRDQARDTYHDYTARGLPDDSLYDDYKGERTQADLLLAVGAGLWIFSAVDAYYQARVLPAEAGRAPAVRWAAGPNAIRAAWSFGGRE